MIFFHPLRRRLTHHLALAYLHSGRRQSFVYFRDVRIEVMVSGKHTSLMVSRRQRYPSWRQWYRIVRAWPYWIDPEPITVQIKERCYLTGAWDSISWWTNRRLTRAVEKLLREPTSQQRKGGKTMTKNPLQERLEKMVTIAAANPSHYQSLRTTQDMKIEVMIDQGYTHLQVSRAGNFPTKQDWANVLRAWPYPLSCLPLKRQRFGRYYLVATWPNKGQRTPRIAFPPGHPRHGKPAGEE